jgi:nucleoside-diphosphate-sugar epimerase
VKAFVTGGTGFLGRHLVDELLAHGYDVTAVVRTMDRARSLPASLQLCPGDVTRRETLRARMRGVDVVFHLAAWYTVGVRPKDRERMYRVNVEGARETLELAAELGVPKIVYTSSVGVYGDTRGQVVDETYRADGLHFASEYERTKYLAHYEVAAPLQQRGAPVIIVCPGVVYGPGDTSQFAPLHRLYARRQLPFMLSPDTALTWAHVDDIAAGHRLAAEKGRAGETYVLAGPALTLSEFFQACERGTGLPAPSLWLPSSVARLLARALRQVQPGWAEVMQNISGITYLARADKAKRELGWNPRPVEVGMAETVERLRAVESR